eukprot:192944-Alexandrium_andersonii.AAC.1
MADTSCWLVAMSSPRREMFGGGKASFTRPESMSVWMGSVLVAREGPGSAEVVGDPVLAHPDEPEEE